MLTSPNGKRIKVRYHHWAFHLPMLRNHRGIVIGRNIWFKQGKEAVDESLLSHEMIHQEQMDRVGVISFYLIYLRDYFVNLLKIRNHRQAYLAIPFEREAYERESKVTSHADPESKTQ